MKKNVIANQMKNPMYLLLALFFVCGAGNAVAGNCTGDPETYVKNFEEHGCGDCVYAPGLADISLNEEWNNERTKTVFKQWENNKYKERILNACRKYMAKKDYSCRYQAACVLAMFKISSFEGVDVFKELVREDAVPRIDVFASSMLGDKRASQIFVEDFYSEVWYENGSKEKTPLPIGYLDNKYRRENMLNAFWFLNDVRTIKFLRYVSENDSNALIRSKSAKVADHIEANNPGYKYNDLEQFYKECKRLDEYKLLLANKDNGAIMEKLTKSTDLFIKQQAEKAIKKIGIQPE
jgi:hypothetical protein